MDMLELGQRWRSLNREIFDWWQADLNKAHEVEIRAPHLNKIWCPDEEHREQESQGSEENTVITKMPAA